MILSWNRTRLDFDDSCLLLPSRKVAELARAENEWLVLELQPGSSHHRHLDAYRAALASLGSIIAEKLA